MFKLNKLTDYALIILCELSQNPVSAQQISQLSSVPLPTTNKILKSLVKSKLALSKGGKNGGFYLAKSLELISLLDVLYSIEGNSHQIIPCVGTHSACNLKSKCKITKNMQTINFQLIDILKNKKVSELLLD